MSSMKHVIRVEPSLRHQEILLLGHLLLVALMWLSLHGHYWPWLLCLLFASLCYGLYQARHRHFTIEIRGDQILWHGALHNIGKGSKVGPGFVWLVLDGPHAERWWLFADSMLAADFRLLAQRIQLLQR